MTCPGPTHSSPPDSASDLRRSASSRHVRVALDRAHRGSVVAGDFNDRNPHAHPLRKRSNGARTAVVTIPTGATLHFRYLAEGGVWFDDETAAELNAQGATLTVPA